MIGHDQSPDEDTDNDEEELVDGENETIKFDQSLPSSHTVSTNKSPIFILSLLYGLLI